MRGGAHSHVNPFSGVASSLVHYGVPAVIGMQFEITDDAAITFADRLYTAVAQGFPIDAALTAGPQGDLRRRQRRRVRHARALPARRGGAPFDVDEVPRPVEAPGDFALVLEWSGRACG